MSIILANEKMRVYTEYEFSSQTLFSFQPKVPTIDIIEKNVKVSRYETQ